MFFSLTCLSSLSVLFPASSSNPREPPPPPPRRAHPRCHFPYLYSYSISQYTSEYRIALLLFVVFFSSLSISLSLSLIYIYIYSEFPSSVAARVCVFTISSFRLRGPASSPFFVDVGCLDSTVTAKTANERPGNPRERREKIQSRAN